MQLTEGAVNKIKLGQSVVSPVVQVWSFVVHLSFVLHISEQVLTIKAMNSASGAPGGQVRYRFTLSDGKETMAGMPATQLNQLILDSHVKEGSIIKLTQFQVNTLPAAASDMSKTPQQYVCYLTTRFNFISRLSIELLLF
jgi:hypothetical protein